MSDYWYGGSEQGRDGVMVLNDSDAPTDLVLGALEHDHPDLAMAGRSLASWFNSTRSRYGYVFDRDKYVTPRRYFEQFRVAERAVEFDDVVSGVYEMTEALAFSAMGFEVEDEEQEDVWNQIARDIDLDARLREMWHDLFTFSQFYAAVYWGQKSYKVRGQTDKGNQRRKSFDNLNVPLGITLLDPRKVIPFGTFVFNQENLIYLADSIEMIQFDAILSGAVEDPIVTQMILGEFEFPGGPVASRRYLNELGYELNSISKMYMLNPSNVWRHTLTRPQYKPLASVRMKSIFELLDLKNQLKEMDRAHLIGATNFIILITKGSDQQPATPGELKALAGYARMSSRVPLIIGDHRLNIEIITPKTDTTLSSEKYDLIDTRITSRLFQMFVNPRGRNEDSQKLARVIARGMENRRHMVSRSIEKNILARTVNANPEFTSDPDLCFYPHRIALDFDMNLATFYLDLRDRGEISRDTMLSEFDIDQAVEARKRKLEKEKYDKTFETAVPFNSPANNPSAPNTDQVTPTGQGTGGAKKAAQGGGAAPAAPATSPATSPRTAGRTLGGNKNGGGAAKPSPNRGKSKGQQ